MSVQAQARITYDPAALRGLLAAAYEAIQRLPGVPAEVEAKLRDVASDLGYCGYCLDPDAPVADVERVWCEQCGRRVHTRCTREVVTRVEDRTRDHPGHVHTERMCMGCADRFERGE